MGKTVTIGFKNVEINQVNPIVDDILKKYGDIDIKIIRRNVKRLFPYEPIVTAVIITVLNSLAYAGIKELIKLIGKKGGDMSLDAANIQRYVEMYLTFELGLDNFKLINRRDDGKYFDFIYRTKDGKKHRVRIFKNYKIEYDLIEAH